MPLTGDHPMHPFVIDAKGDLFVDSGSATNSCQSDNRMPVSPGIQPCTELETRAGTWRYEADKTGQVFSAAERFATGIRNGEGFAFDTAGRLFVTQHGRDQLSQNWPKLYTVDEGADLPAEEVLQLHQGADFGWPECYYDQNQNRLVPAPEYGGDGGKTAGVCDSKQAPVAAFPGHWAPNDLLIYTGGQFPEPYRGGAFIAFHGSWNRAPLPQGGYDVVFQPMADGKKSGDYVIFANGFAGAHVDPGRAAFRPTGLAIGSDGALYISDDVHGRIWRVVYKGDPTTAQIAPAPQAAVAAASATSPQPPEGTHADAGRSAEALRPPPGATGQEVALASAFSMAKRATALAVVATDRTPGAPRSGPASATASGFGATEACRRSRRRSRPACLARETTRASCRRRAARISRTRTSRPSPPMSGRLATRRTDEG
jgi:hypothetical protein